MTDEPAHTASKESMAPESMFCLNVCPDYQLLTQSEVAIMLRFQLYSARYTVLQTKNSRRSPSAIRQSNHHENMDNLHVLTINY